jgi:hypothetical protein
LEPWARRKAVVSHPGQEPLNIYGVRSRYQATTSQDIADWEDLMCAVVNFRVRELAIAL